MSLDDISSLDTVGERVLAARIKAGYANQADFAKAIGMNTRRGISRIETGTIPENYREAISRVTGLPAEAMMRDPDEVSDTNDRLAKLAERVEQLADRFEKHLADQASHQSRPATGRSKQGSRQTSGRP